MRPPVFLIDSTEDLHWLEAKASSDPRLGYDPGRVLSFVPDVLERTRTKLHQPWETAHARDLTQRGWETFRVLANFFYGKELAPDLRHFGSSLVYETNLNLQAVLNCWQELYGLLSMIQPSQVFAFERLSRLDESWTQEEIVPVEPLIYSFLIKDVSEALGIPFQVLRRSDSGGDTNVSARLSLPVPGRFRVIVAKILARMIRRGWIEASRFRSKMRLGAPAAICIDGHVSLRLHLESEGCLVSPVRLASFAEESPSSDGTFRMRAEDRELLISRLMAAPIVACWSGWLRQTVADLVVGGIEKRVPALRSFERRLQTFIAHLKPGQTVYMGQIYRAPSVLAARLLKAAGHRIAVMQHGGGYGLIHNVAQSQEFRHADQFLCLGPSTKTGLEESIPKIRKYLDPKKSWPPIELLPVTNVFLKSSGAAFLRRLGSMRLFETRRRSVRVLLVTTGMQGNRCYVASYRQRDCVEYALQRRALETLEAVAQEIGIRIDVYFKPYDAGFAPPWIQAGWPGETLRLIPIRDGFAWDYVDLADVIVLPTPMTTLLEALTERSGPEILAYFAVDQGLEMTEVAKNELRHAVRVSLSLDELENDLREAVQDRARLISKGSTRSVSKQTLETRRERDAFRRNFL